MGLGHEPKEMANAKRAEQREWHSVKRNRYSILFGCEQCGAMRWRCHAHFFLSFRIFTDKVLSLIIISERVEDSVVCRCWCHCCCCLMWWCRFCDMMETSIIRKVIANFPFFVAEHRAGDRHVLVKWLRNMNEKILTPTTIGKKNWRTEKANDWKGNCVFQMLIAFLTNSCVFFCSFVCIFLRQEFFFFITSCCKSPKLSTQFKRIPRLISRAIKSARLQFFFSIVDWKLFRWKIHESTERAENPMTNKFAKMLLTSF